MKTKILFLLIWVFGVGMPLFSGTYPITQNDVISLTSGYVDNMNEVWNVQSIVTDKPLKITYLTGTEYGYDFVTINSVDNQGVATTLLTLSGTKSGVISTLIPNGKAQIIFTSDGSVSNYNDPEDPRDPEDPNPYLGLNISFAVDNDNIIYNNLHVSGNTQTEGDMYVKGRIGLGTTTPTKKFEILEGNGGRFSFSAANCNSGYEVSQTVDDTGYKLNVGSSIRDYRLAVNGTNRFMISTAGNVGIGTTSPSQSLSVTGRFTIAPSGANPDNGYNGNIVVTKPAASGQYINLIRQGQYPWSIGTVYNTSFFAIGKGKATDTEFSNPYFVIAQETGNVGIGTTTPAYKLDVAAGDMRVSNYSPTICLQRNASSGGFVQGIQTKLADGTDHWYYGVLDNTWIVSKGNFNSPKLTILDDGKVGIGTTQIPDSFKLAVAGKIIAEEVVVKLASNWWPDYVFKPDYNLMPLHQVEQFVTANNHLPGIPSAAEVQNDGLSMGEMQNKLLQKIEELTLYIIEQDKKITNLEERLK